MGLLACTGAMMTCSFGSAPAALNVLPTSRPVGSLPMANIMDYVPFTNVPTFGTCSSMSNPVVAAASAAAGGALTPSPCVPNTTTPWTPGLPAVLIADMPALDMDSKLMCSWGGSIAMTNAGQTITQGA